MKNEEKEIGDQFKELNQKFISLKLSLNALKGRQQELSIIFYPRAESDFVEEKVRPMINDSNFLVEEIEDLASEIWRIKEDLMITQEELRIIREKSDPISVIYTKVPLSIRIFALLVSPLSIIQIWKMISSPKKSKRRYKEEEDLPYRVWE